MGLATRECLLLLFYLSAFVQRFYLQVSHGTISISHAEINFPFSSQLHICLPCSRPYIKEVICTIYSATASAPLCRVINSPTRHPLPMMSTIIYVAALNPKRNRNTTTARRAEDEEILNSNENVNLFTFLLNLTNELFHIHPSTSIDRYLSSPLAMWSESGLGDAVFDREDNVPHLEEEMKTSHSNDTSQI